MFDDHLLALLHMISRSQTYILTSIAGLCSMMSVRHVSVEAACCCLTQLRSCYNPPAQPPKSTQNVQLNRFTDQVCLRRVPQALQQAQAEVAANQAAGFIMMTFLNS